MLRFLLVDGRAVSRFIFGSHTVAAASPNRSTMKRALVATPHDSDVDLASLDGVTDPDSPPRWATWLRRVLLSGTVAMAVAVTGIAVTTFGTSSAPSATGVELTTLQHTDTSHAVPETSRRDGSSTGTTSNGGLAAFDSTSTSRSNVRSALTSALTSQDQQNRTSSLNGTASDASSAAAADLAEARNEVLASDIANAKKQAKKFAAEQSAAVEQLKKLGMSGTDATALAAGESDSDHGVTPIAKGHYTVGAYWHEYGVWAKWHTGQDFPAAVGTPIRAVADGVVGSSISASWPGINVVIHHANGGSTVYCHMQAKLVQPGQVVKAGQVIGYVGLTGRTFGPHLHFEYYPAGATPGDVYSTENPVVFLKSLGVSI